MNRRHSSGHRPPPGPLSPPPLGKERDGTDTSPEVGGLFPRFADDLERGRHRHGRTCSTCQRSRAGAFCPGRAASAARLPRATRSMSSLRRPATRWVRASAVPPTKCSRSAKRAETAASRCEIIWSRSTCSGATPKQPRPRRARRDSPLLPHPALGPAQRGPEPLRPGEFRQPLAIAAPVQRGNRRAHVRLRATESRPSGQVEHRLLGGRHQRAGSHRAAGPHSPPSAPHGRRRRQPRRHPPQQLLARAATPGRPAPAAPRRSTRGRLGAARRARRAGPVRGAGGRTRRRHPQTEAPASPIGMPGLRRTLERATT